MFVLITYDVSTLTAEGRTRLRKISKQCQNYGQRVQNSVFECVIQPADWVVVKDKLIRIIDKEKDSLRFYYMGKNYKQNVEHVGVKEALDFEGVIIL